MTLKDYCKEKKISARNISLTSRIPYSTVNDLLNGKTELARTSFGIVCKIADCLNLGLDDLRKLFDDKPSQYDNNDHPRIFIRNKRYYLEWNSKRIDLCKVNALNGRNIEDIAAWTLRDLKARQELEKQNDILFNARR